jgi:hypothetical protein
VICLRYGFKVSLDSQEILDICKKLVSTIEIPRLRKENDQKIFLFVKLFDVIAVSFGDKMLTNLRIQHIITSTDKKETERLKGEE